MVNENSAKKVMDTFIALYSQRDRNMQFNDWFGDVLMQQFPEMSESDSRNLAGEIIEGVAKYDKALAEVDSAFDEGFSKDEWFAEKMAEEYSDMPIDEAGEKLEKLSSAYDEINVPIMNELDEENEYSLSVPEKSSVEWNEYNVKDMARNIGKKAVFAAVGVAANVVKHKAEQGDEIDIKEAVGEALHEDIATNPEEVKAVVAGAVKSAAMMGLEKALPKEIPVDAACDMAGVAVESAKALFDAANRNSSTSEAADKIGRAGVAAGSKIGVKALKGYLSTLPAGELAVDLLGGLFDYLESSAFADKAVNAIKARMQVVKEERNIIIEAATATWNGIKKSNIVQKAKSVFNTIGSKIKQTLFAN